MSGPNPQEASLDLTIATQQPAVFTLEGDVPGPRLITHQDVVGWMTHWAVRQHPYGRPDGMFDVTDRLSEASEGWPDGVPSLRMWRVSGYLEIEQWMREALKDHPVLTAWNTPRSGHTQQIVASSRYWTVKAEHDFIDIDALLRNVALSTWRRACD